MILFTEALERIRAEARPFGTEEVPLWDARGRVLAQSLVADRDYPPFNRVAMDGFAIRFEDYEKGIRRFEVLETVFAGATPSGSLKPGTCYRIMTGAALPADADTVVKIEDVWVRDNHMQVVAEDYFRYRHLALQGEDLVQGTPLMVQPSWIDPATLALLATLGYERVQVQRLPAVALFTTGNEVVPVDGPVGPVQIRNGNSWLLRALLAGWGVEPKLIRHLPDEAVLMTEALTEALSCDMIILCGGVSAGDADFVPQVLDGLGVFRLFHKLAIKPGKPIWCGRLPQGGLVFGLPGNPFSCLVTFTLFVQHYLRLCFGLLPVEPLRLPMGVSRTKKTPLDEFFPVALECDPVHLNPMPINGSGDIRLGLGASGLALHPAALGDLQAETVLSVYPLGGPGGHF